jgi:SAM-dependent methyltransferase
MFEFHLDKTLYFNMQTENAEEFVLPFIEEKLKIDASLTVLEVGSAEGGVIKAFAKKGCQCVGVELNDSRAIQSREFLKEYIEKGQIQIINKNIYDSEFETEFHEKFDLIILKDVIEHIPDQQKVMFQFRKFLKTNGKIYFGFPPFRMPFGGHQQVCQSKILSKLPYFHLLPMPLYKLVLKAFGENIEEFVEIKETGISIARFHKICDNANFEIVNKLHYLINPIYKYKFGLEPRKQFSFIEKIPYFKDFVTTCVFYLVEKKG